MTPQNIDLRRRLLEWRDNHSSTAALELNRLWLDLKPAIAEKLAGVSLRSALTEPNGYIVREIDPLLASHLEPRLAELVGAARKDLIELAERHFELSPTMSPSDDEEDHIQSAMTVLSSVAPLAGGLAMGIALPSFAVVSGTAAFGLIATSTISLPIVVGGVAAAGTLFATGFVKTSQLQSFSADRMMKRVESHVRRALLSTDQSVSPPSVLRQLYDAYQNAFEAAAGEVCD